MTNWEHFPVTDKRPDAGRVFREAERYALERTISEQVATLLSDYATCEPAEIDNSCSDIEDPKTYHVLALDPILMEDDGELVIHQIPLLGDGFAAQEGLHCIETVDEDEVTKMQFACWDPDIDTEQRIIDAATGERVPLKTLQELHEALIICSFMVAQTSEVNLLPHDTSAYPIAVVEPEFEALIKDLLS